MNSSYIKIRTPKNKHERGLLNKILSRVRGHLDGIDLHPLMVPAQSTRQARTVGVSHKTAAEDLK